MLNLQDEIRLIKTYFIVNIFKTNNTFKGLEEYFTIDSIIRFNSLSLNYILLFD